MNIKKQFLFVLLITLYLAGCNSAPQITITDTVEESYNATPLHVSTETSTPEDNPIPTVESTEQPVEEITESAENLPGLCNLGDNNEIIDEDSGRYLIGWVDEWMAFYVYSYLDYPIVYTCYSTQTSVTSDTVLFNQPYFSNAFLPESVLAAFIDDMHNLVGYDYSEQYGKVLYQQYVEVDDKIYLELWEIDLNTQTKRLILDGTKYYIDLIVPGTVTWLDAELIFIDFPWLDWPDYFIDLESGTADSLFSSCGQYAISRVIFSPDHESILFLLPDNPVNYKYADNYAVYLMDSQTFLSNLDTCNSLQSDEVVENVNTLLSGNVEKLPLPMLSLDIFGAYPGIYWNDQSDHLYLLDRDESSPYYGDIISYDINEHVKEVLLEFEAFEHITLDRSNSIKFVISPNQESVYFLDMYDYIEVKVPDNTSSDTD